MKRKESFKVSRSETEMMLLQAARHAFLKFGYNGVTMERISRFAGMNKSAVYYYFRSKDQLYGHVLRYYIQHLLRLLNTAGSESTTMGLEQHKIEYPEIFAVAWFIANELHTNADLALKVINEDPEIRKSFHDAYENQSLQNKFERLIRLNIHGVIQKCRLRIEPI
jgi:AcrR family transcriptional regulator